MRRKETRLRRKAPKALRRFNPDDWPGETQWRQYEAYWAAVKEYLDVHPDAEESIESPGDIPWNPEVDPP